MTRALPLMISAQSHRTLKEMILLACRPMVDLLDILLERHGPSLLSTLHAEAANAKLRPQGRPPLQPKWKPPPPHRRYIFERVITKFAKGKPLGILPERQRDDPAELG